MEYQIVTADSSGELAGQVDVKMSQGWKPQGGVALSVIYDSKVDCYIEYWAQAMIKERE